MFARSASRFMEGLPAQNEQIKGFEDAMEKMKQEMEKQRQEYQQENEGRKSSPLMNKKFKRRTDRSIGGSARPRRVWRRTEPGDRALAQQHLVDRVKEFGGPCTRGRRRRPYSASPARPVPFRPWRPIVGATRQTGPLQFRRDPMAFVGQDVVLVITDPLVDQRVDHFREPGGFGVIAHQVAP